MSVRLGSLYQLGYQQVKLNKFVYNACLNAFAKRGDDFGSNAEEATQLVELMKQQYLDKGDMLVKPEVICVSVAPSPSCCQLVKICSE
jgi:hypothetical protein